MKILMTNHQLINYGGTEVFTFTLAKSLKQKGHEVVVYSAYLGKIAEMFREIDVQVIDNLENIDTEFDIAHVHHNINAFEIRNRFPTLPMVFMSHGVSPELEQPPFLDLGISKYLAISEEVKKNIHSHEIPQEDILIVRNLIDEIKYYPYLPINPFPKNALVISNKIDLETEKVIRKACEALSISCTFIGARFKSIPNDEMPVIINQHDLVFSLGRGVVEAMLCGRVPIVIDSKVGDGMVTTKNFFELAAFHFSGRIYWKEFSVPELVEEIKKYRQEYGEQLRSLALEEFSVSKNTEKLLQIYSKCYFQRTLPLDPVMTQKISDFSQSILKTRKYASDQSRRLLRAEMIRELGGDRLYLFFKSLGNLRRKLIPPKDNLSNLG